MINSTAKQSKVRRKTVDNTFKAVLDMFARVDSARRNMERAAKAENYYSAAYLATELSSEAKLLADNLSKLARIKSK